MKTDYTISNNLRIGGTKGAVNMNFENTKNSFFFLFIFIKKNYEIFLFFSK